MDIGAWLTLFLGLAAVAAIGVNFYIHRRDINFQRDTRKDDIDREHKRQTLNEIREWARTGYQLFCDYQQLGEISRPRSREELEKELTIVFTDLDAMNLAALKFDEDFREPIDFVDEFLDEYWQHNAEWTGKERDDCANKLEVCFSAVMHQVAFKRAELKL